MKSLFSSIILTLFCVCAAYAEPPQVCLQPTDQIVAMDGCVASIQTNTLTDPVQSIAHQVAIPGPVILWPGDKGHITQYAATFPTLISESTKYPGKFPWVYLYDEIGWCGTGLCYFTDEDIVLQGAAIAHAAGVKTLVTILPDVILDPRFALKDINAFDGISIDVYPSIRPTVPNLGGCSSGVNYLGDLFYCSVQKLRSMGFRGQIGYIYQAFGMHSETEQSLTQKFIDQRAVINNASALGADYIMPFGLYLGAPEIAAEPLLFQCAGTFCENLVRP